MWAAIGLKLLGIGSAVKRGWGMVPERLKLILLAVVLAVILGFVHQIYAHRQAAKHYHAGYVQAQADDAAKAKKLKDQLDAATAKIAQLERNRLNADITRINRGADTVLMRGPGKAVCPGSSPATGGHQALAGAGNAEVAGVPPSGGVDLIALPFPDTVAFGRQCDINGAENASWHRWYDALVKAWPKARP
jgi:hypothetical protein